MSDEDPKTVIERFNAADEERQIALGTLIISDRMKQAGMDLVRKRRHDLAASLSIGNLSHTEVVDSIKERENDFLELYYDGEIKEQLPEWLMRAEAQDILAENIYKEFKNENIID